MREFGWEVGDAGARVLADALQGNATLTSLDLRYNDISTAGARPFAEALAVNATLEELGLDRNAVWTAVRSTRLEG